jgi:hypothetical protein
MNLGGPITRYLPDPPDFPIRVAGWTRHAKQEVAYKSEREDDADGTARLDSGATMFLFKSDFNPSLIALEKATANIHGYGASMT